MWFGLRPALRASKFVPDEFVGIHDEMTGFRAKLRVLIGYDYKRRKTMNGINFQANRQIWLRFIEVV